MSNLIQHAERELKLAGLGQNDSDYDGMLYDAVMELVRVFSKQGHSGFSARKTLSLFHKVAGYENLLPLTGKDDEWNEINDNTFQNNRISSVFKDESGPYYLNAIVWIEEDGTVFTGNVEKYSSRQFIKGFPFSPKTFYIGVIKENDDFVVKDKNQLKKVFNYYKKPKKNSQDIN